jgi:F0F1-type ATP synthase epsilon subunit
MRNQQVNYNGLNEVQIGLLRMFSRPMTKEQSLKIKRGIVNILSDELDIEVERVVKEKGITKEDFEALRNQHQKTPKNK